MMRLLVSVCTLLVLSAISCSADGPVTEPVPLLIWAATDPKEDNQVGKIDAVKFYQFTEKYRDTFLEIYNKGDILGAIKFLHEHAEESGTQGVIWPLVFAKILKKKVVGPSEEEEHGLPSLVVWAVRDTGVGTSIPDTERTKLVSFLLANKTKILEFIYGGDVDGLTNFLKESDSESGAKGIDWETVVKDLKANRKLFKHSCGILNLSLCD